MSNKAISRRAAVGGIGVAAAAAISHGAAARAADGGSLADHPMAGTWLVSANPGVPDAPQIGNVAHFWADGTVLLGSPVTGLTPGGVQFNSAGHGIWEIETDRRIRFTSVQLLSDADGNFTGTLTVDGHPEASEDGQTFVDDGELVVITIRDAAGAIAAQFSAAGGRPVNGLRMVFGAPRFPAPVPAE